MHPSGDAPMPLLLTRERCALVLVDYQTRLMPSIHGGEAALQRALLLAHSARALGVPVVGTEQNPRGLGPNDERVHVLCEHTVSKMHFNAADDGLTGWLRQRNPAIDQVVVAGCEAHVCLMQSALGLLRDGLRVCVAADACGSRRPDDKALALQRLVHSGALLVSSEMVVFEWLRSCSEPPFKAVLQLVKQYGA